MKSKPNRWSAAEIAVNLISDDRWLYRALKAIFERQTPVEQAEKTTREQNGMGFNAVDAEILSGLAEHYVTKGWLSPRQMQIARKKLPKYAGQLARIAKDKK